MPTTKQKWADEPFHLITTKPFSKDSSHEAYYVATQMAHAHNGMLRGLNSIYQQATRIPAKDATVVRDFLTYCQCWSESMHHHHDCEEEFFFPEIERIAGEPGLMAANVQQHQAFMPGFEEFITYARTCQPREYDGQKVVALIDGFATPLVQHLNDEISTLRALDRYDSVRVRQAYQGLEKQLSSTDNFRIAQIVFGTSDRTFEGGNNFPPVPFFVPSLVHYVFGWKYRGAWQFNPCTPWRDPKPLAYGA